MDVRKLFTSFKDNGSGSLNQCPIDTPPSPPIGTLSFVQMQSGSTASGAACTRSARSQVMRQSIRKRRLSAIRKNEHFHIVTPETVARSRGEKKPSSASSKSRSSDHDPMSAIAATTPDPFAAIEGDTHELFRLMRYGKSHFSDA